MMAGMGTEMAKQKAVAREKQREKLIALPEKVRSAAEYLGGDWARFSRDTMDAALALLDERIEEILVKDIYRRLAWQPRILAFSDSPDGIADLPCEERELALTRLICEWWTQFSVSPTKGVFAPLAFDLTPESHRVYITGLSAVIDEAARLLLAKTAGKGGRFHFDFHKNEVVSDGGKEVFARLVEA